MEGSGRWAWRGIGDARLVAGPAALARLPGVPPELGLDGSARAQIEMSLSAMGAQGTARVDAERLSVAKIALGRGTGEAALQGRRLNASLKFPERQLEMSVRGELAPGQALAARMALPSFDLASMAGPPPAGQAPMLRGVISASADLAIPTDAPRNLQGRLALQPMTLIVAGSSWSSPAALVARVDGQRATLEPARLAGPAGAITASGVVWDAGERPLVSVKLDARLAALAPASGLDGRLRAEAELSGGAGTVAGTQARARIDGDGIRLPGPLARLGPGTSHADLQLADGVVSIAKGDVVLRRSGRRGRRARQPRRPGGAGRAGDRSRRAARRGARLERLQRDGHGHGHGPGHAEPAGRSGADRLRPSRRRRGRRRAH